MTKRNSKIRVITALNDYQVLKGKCERTMEPFGEPMSALHEARLIVEDDRSKLPAGSQALYVVHQRSKNRIVHIVRQLSVAAVPVLKAA